MLIVFRLYIIVTEEECEEKIYMTGILIIILVIGIFYWLINNKHNSDYQKESGNELSEIIKDKGKYGEYLLFNKLKEIDGEYRILTNVYLPMGNGKMTEVDIIYIHETGIYVFESKNYGGWIYGMEENKFWIQSLKNGRKENFYNPIWQNNTHIKYLSRLLKFDEKSIKSIIVFSERCSLKKIELYSENIKVITINEVKRTMENIIDNSHKEFNSMEIIELYDKLKKYSKVKAQIKEKHLEQIKQNIEF